MSRIVVRVNSILSHVDVATPSLRSTPPASAKLPESGVRPIEPQGLSAKAREAIEALESAQVLPEELRARLKAAQCDEEACEVMTAIDAWLARAFPWVQERFASARRKARR
jgi:hypothetical protein